MTFVHSSETSLLQASTELNIFPASFSLHTHLFDLDRPYAYPNTQVRRPKPGEAATNVVPTGLWGLVTTPQYCHTHDQEALVC